MYVYIIEGLHPYSYLKFDTRKNCRLCLHPLNLRNEMFNLNLNEAVFFTKTGKFINSLYIRTKQAVYMQNRPND